MILTERASLEPTPDERRKWHLNMAWECLVAARMHLEDAVADQDKVKREANQPRASENPAKP